MQIDYLLKKIQSQSVYHANIRYTVQCSIIVLILLQCSGQLPRWVSNICNRVSFTFYKEEH